MAAMSFIAACACIRTAMLAPITTEEIAVFMTSQIIGTTVEQHLRGSSFADWEGTAHARRPVQAVHE